MSVGRDGTNGRSILAKASAMPLMRLADYYYFYIAWPHDSGGFNSFLARTVFDLGSG